MADEDIRWQQRFSNYKRAFAQLTKFMEKKDLIELEQQGVIQAFAYTHELAWNTLKDFLESRGNTAIYGSRDATSCQRDIALENNRRASRPHPHHYFDGC